jgi:hypothetical protein
VAALPAEPLHLGHRNTLDADVGDSLPHIVQFEWLYDRHDQFHCYSPFPALVPDDAARAAYAPSFF